MVAMLACHNLTKTFGCGAVAETALQDVTLSFQAGESAVLLGPSGSGKTTLLSILGCLLSPTAGTVTMGGTSIDYSSKGSLTRLRRDQIGFIFQHAQLLPFLTVKDNLTTVARNVGLSTRDSSSRINVLLDHLGIARYANRKPRDLSGGQRQRVSIARALLHRPKIILADEPTAALDWDNGSAAIGLLVEQARSYGALLIVVTHDLRVTPLCNRVIYLESGKVREA